jgi:hypothetical protein
MPLKFVVTGCGRSGTKHTSQFFRQLGIKCGHEGVFDHCAKRGEYEADCSWLAAPILAGSDDYAGTPVLHQVRNPVHVIRSMMRIGSFHQPYRATAQYAIEHLGPYVAESAEPLELCMKFWLYWNQIAASLEDKYPYMRFRLEEMPLAVIARFVKCKASITELNKAKKAVGTNVNSRPRHKRDDSVKWSTLPDNGIKQAIAFQAQAYGYSHADLESA